MFRWTSISRSPTTRASKAAVPTIQYLLDHGAGVVLMSHLGRPKNKVVDKLRLAPAATRLGELLGREVKQVNVTIGPEAEAGGTGAPAWRCAAARKYTFRRARGSQ